MSLHPGPQLRSPHLQRLALRCARTARASRYCLLPCTAGEPPQQRASEDAYNKAMAAYSQSPYTYQHEAGLYYHSITSSLLVGTQPRSPADLDRLTDEEGVTCILNTQQDKDMEYWHVDFSALREHCSQRSLLLARQPFPDFDGEGLRAGLPSAVALLDRLLRSGHRVYCHCTAGMGRSPGVAIGYLYWLQPEHASLDAAYAALTSVRPCGPNKEAIRLATCDLLHHGGQGGSLPSVTGRAYPPHEGTQLDAEQRLRIERLLRDAILGRD